MYFWGFVIGSLYLVHEFSLNKRSILVSEYQPIKISTTVLDIIPIKNSICSRSAQLKSLLVPEFSLVKKLIRFEIILVKNSTRLWLAYVKLHFDSKDNQFKTVFWFKIRQWKIYVAFFFVWLEVSMKT